MIIVLRGLTKAPTKNISCVIPQHAAEQEKVAVNSLKELPLLRDKKNALNKRNIDYQLI